MEGEEGGKRWKREKEGEGEKDRRREGAGRGKGEKICRTNVKLLPTRLYRSETKQKITGGNQPLMKTN